MNKRRLLKLADLLEEDAKNKQGIRFDWGHWGSIADAERPMSCGTRACALGLAAISGKFKRAGLGYRIRRDSTRIQITFNGRGADTIDAFRAGARTFDISLLDSEFLFAPDGGKVNGGEAERRVAQRIRDFVAGKATP